FIENSETFRTMCSLPQAATGTVEGDSDDKHIQLQGVSRVDFRLLKFLYRQNDASPLEPSLEDWISLLKLSAMWEMTDIRNAAISEMLKRKLKINVTEQISLGKKYDVPTLVISGIVELVSQQ
ncbi:hypothetical protein EDD18DRAFT_1076673, partial [Armillaria luteobubalina]